MLIEPKTRGFICTTAHPTGCAQHVQEQIDYLKKQQPLVNGPKNVLVVGASNGFGLSSRIVASFGGSKSKTIGVFFEKESDGKRTATAGWYNSVAFEQKAREAGIYAASVNGDAFSQEIKDKVVKLIKKDLGQIDLLVYSLASPRRQDEKTGKLHKSVLKPIKGEYTNKSLDLSNNQLISVTLPQANQEEIDDTVKVMGGEDWEAWIDLLEKEGLLAKGFKTVAYSYIGPSITHAIYRLGTIGRAKDHLELTSQNLDKRLRAKGGRAFISVNKALVTQSSSAIPFIPLYFVLLKKVMKEKGIEEDCIQQMWRLFSVKLYNGAEPVVDQKGFLRVDDWELRDDVQKIVVDAWAALTVENLSKYADLEGFQEDFLKLFGFSLKKVDYSKDVDIDLKLPSGVA